MSVHVALEGTGPEDDGGWRIHRTARLLAPVCLTLAVLLLRLRFGWVLAVVRGAIRWCGRPATAAEAAGMSAAVAAAARHRSGRVACLETSLAAVLLACLRRRSVAWCIGVRFMPYASHAWVEQVGRQVGEPGRPGRPHHVIVRVAPPFTDASTPGHPDPLRAAPPSTGTPAANTAP